MNTRNRLRSHLLLASLCWVATVRAAAPLQVLLFAPGGSAGMAATKSATAALRANPGLHVLRAQEVARAIAKLHASPKTEEGRQRLVRVLHAQVAVRLFSAGSRSAPVLSARVYRGDDGSEVGEATWPITRTTTPRSRAGGRLLRELVLRAGKPAQAPAPVPPSPKVVELERDSPVPTPPSSASPPQQQPTAPTADARPSSPPAQAALAPPLNLEEGRDTEGPATSRTSETPLLDLAVEVSTLTRNLRYQDDPTASQSPYQLVLGPTFGGTLEAYPLMAVTPTMAGQLGLRLAAESAVGLESANDRGTHFPTSSNALEVALTYRIPLSAVTLIPAVGYGRETFAISLYPGQQSRPDVPGVIYRRIRPVLDARVKLGHATRLLLRAAYLKVLSEGQIASDSYFPHTSASGLEGGLGVAFAVGTSWEARLVGYYRRYSLSFNPAPGDARQAGGAVDQFFGVTLGLAYRGL